MKQHGQDFFEDKGHWELLKQKVANPELQVICLDFEAAINTNNLAKLKATICKLKDLERRLR